MAASSGFEAAGDGTVATYAYGRMGGPEVLHLGVARMLPRGVARTDYRARGYFDIWLPALAPSRALVLRHHRGEIAFPAFARAYIDEVTRPSVIGVVHLVAALARTRPVAVGCFCKDAATCHRRVLAELIAGLSVEHIDAAAASGFASPACLLREVWEPDDDPPEHSQ